MLTSRQLNTIHKFSVRTLIGLGLTGTALSLLAVKQLLSNRSKLSPVTPNAPVSEEIKG